MSNKNSDHYFLRGGGEMGELIRAKDWSKTSLGDPADWPQSLCTMVAVMLDNPFGMYIAWGSEYIQLYNDGYRPILGTTKHPQALGISTRETFAEIWHIIESMFDGVMKGKAVGFPDFMLPLNRNGFVEECYFDFSYSPIRKDNGEVGGVLVTVIETTDKKKAQVALLENSTQLKFAMDAAELGAWDYNPATNKFTANNRLKTWFGLSASEEIELHHATDAIAEKDRDRIIMAIKKVLDYSSGGIYEEEYSIINPITNKEIIVQGKGRVGFNDERIAYRFNGVLQEVTENVLARKKIEESEQRFRLALAGSNQIVFSQDKNLIHSWIYNPHPDFTQNDIIGKSDEDLHAPESAAVLTSIKQTVLDTGNAFNGDIEIEVAGKKANYTLHIEAIKDSDETITGIIGTSTDITERIKIEQRVKESEEQFSTLADNMENLVWLADCNGERYWYNKRWLEYTGLTMEESQGWGWQKVHHPDHVDRLSGNKKIWHTNETFELTLPLRRHDGEYRWFLIRGFPLVNEEGQIIRWIGTNTDIDEQKKAEEQFKMLADQAPMWVWQTDKEINVLYANPEVLRFIGIAHYTEFTGHMWEQKVHPEDIALVYKSFGEAVSLQQSFSFEFRVLNASTQQYEWFYIKAVPRLELGEFTGFIGTGININEQKLTLSQLEYRKALLESHNEASLDGILLVDTQGKILAYNHRFVEIWNMPQQIVDDKDDEAALAFALTQLVNPEQFIVKVKWLYEHPDETSIDELEFKNGKIIERHGYPVASADGSYYAWSWMFRDITEQRKSEKTIKESEERFQAAVKAVQGILWTNNAKGEMEGEQPGWALLTGQSYEEYQGYGWAKAVHTDDAQPTVDAWQEAVEERKTFIFEHRVKTKDEGWRDFSIRAIPLVNPDGSLREWVGVHTDITERKHAEKSLKENETKLNLIIEASELGTYEINVETQKVTCSERFREIMGFGDNIQLNLQETVKRIHPSYLQLREEAFKKAYETGILHFIGQIIWQDNSIHWVESKGKVFYDLQKKPKTIVGTISDITQEKLQQQILLESEQKFRLLADSMPQHIWTADTEGNLNYFNQSVFDFSGLTLEQINKDGWLQIVHPDDRQENIQQWFNAISTGQDFLFEHRFRRHDGQYRWQLSRAIPQKDENGKIQMWVGTSTDIQEQKVFVNELERQVKERTKELEHNNIELEKMNKELQSFAYISSHDLQEPLRKIQTFSTRLVEKEYNNLTENGKDQFRRMQKAAERMQTLINDLLAYSRTSTSDRKYEYTDLNKMVEEIKEDLKEELQQKHATIEATELCEINIIPFQFRQLLHNLISNSLKFSDTNRAPHIKIKSEFGKSSEFKNDKLLENTQYCHISISDNGIGFEQHFSEKIFELFQRLHGKTEYHGTGIGLAIVKKIVENHNGIITANSHLNKGATFDIYLPTT